MPKKLSDNDQRRVFDLSRALSKLLPREDRAMGGGIASGLVRKDGDGGIAENDVRAVLDKYKAGTPAFDALVRTGVLALGGSGRYTLHVPDEDEAKALAAAEEARAEGAEGADAEAASPSAAGAGATSVSPGSAAGKPAKGHGKKAIAKAGPRGLAKRGRLTLAKLNLERRQTPELTLLRAQIIDLHPRLWINGWLLSTPEAFTRYERELRALDAVLTRTGRIGDGSLSMRELSYAVFGDEKFLAIDSDGRKLLHLLGLSEFIDAKPQAKLGFAHHIPKRRRHLRLIVSENLDPYLNVRDLMYSDGRKRVLGERIHGVVFGDGFNVTDAHRLPDFAASLGAEEVELLYWGDLDRAGLNTLAKLTETAKESGAFSVVPFMAAYKAMLEHAMDRFADPLDNEPCGQEGLSLDGLELVEPLLKPKQAAYLRSSLESSRLIPQEILTKADL